MNKDVRYDKLNHIQEIPFTSAFYAHIYMHSIGKPGLLYTTEAAPHTNNNTVVMIIVMQ